ncbi:MAG: hypothetical protein OEX03_08985 [Gammaproteobacteria bacterium]|nr:hypothetical protein [Gammaproteobacteria bacterium]
MHTKHNVIIAILIVIIVGMMYKFLYEGNTVDMADGRRAIILTTSERDNVLADMRIFLSSVQQITDGISKKNSQKVINSAQAVGSKNHKEPPGTLIAKLPLQFKMLGSDTHKKFDALALDAQQRGVGEHTLSQLSSLMNNCISCHATYRLETTQQ